MYDLFDPPFWLFLSFRELRFFTGRARKMTGLESSYFPAKRFHFRTAPIAFCSFRIAMYTQGRESTEPCSGHAGRWAGLVPGDRRYPGDLDCIVDVSQAITPSNRLTILVT